MRITLAAREAIEAHAREADPEECCGLLLGAGGTISRARRATNHATDRRRRYEIDPHDHFAAIREARSGGMEVIGAYHSHPRSQPVPSATDRAEAFADFVFVIAGRPPGDPARVDAFELRAWQVRGGNFVELVLVSDP